MRRTLWRLSLLWAFVGALVWWAAPPAGADRSTVGTAAESWYSTAPCTAVPCDLSSGPVPLPTTLSVPIPTATANPFPTGTLHIGVSAGEEVARSYIKLDLSSLPFDASLQGGTLTLPVVAGQTAGTVREETAQIQACFMVSEFHGGDAGVVAAPPEPDCSTKAPAHLVTQQTSEAFTLDLAAFTARWADGEPNNGIALMAADGASPSADTWQVAISGKGSTGPQITAELRYALPAESAPETFPQPQIFVPSPLAQAPLLPAPAASAVAQPTPPPVAPIGFATRGFEYAAIFLLPLAGLVLSGLLGYSLTREVVLPDA